MKVKEIRDKKDNELIKLLASKREELREFRFKIASNQQKNIKEGLVAKNDIAKLLTVMKERILLKED